MAGYTMRWLARIYTRLTEGHRTDRLEYWLTLHSLLFGVWLLLPGQTFAGTSSWATIASLGLSEELVGTIFAGLGILKFIAIRRASLRTRRIVAGMLLVAWVMTFLSFVVSNLSLTGVPTYGLVAAGWFWVYVSLGPEYSASEPDHT